MLQRAFDRFNRIPAWLRPSAIGVAFVLMFAVSRGALIVVPLVVVAVLIWSPSPWVHIWTGVTVYLIVLCGAAVGGFSYYFIGRHLRRIPFVGVFLAAYVSVLPYMYALLSFVRVKESRPMAGLPDSGEHAVALGIGVFFAGAISYGWYRESKVPEHEHDAA